MAFSIGDISRISERNITENSISLAYGRDKRFLSHSKRVICHRHIGLHTHTYVGVCIGRHTNQFNDALAQFEFEQIGFSVPRLGGGNINRNRFSFTDQTGKESRRRQRGLALIALAVAVCEAVSDLDFLLSRHYCPSSFPFVMRRRLLK